ncbi:SCO3933 family regulatory protein [Streptomyces sp. NPDC003032]
MQQIPVDTVGATLMVAQPPQPKYANQKTQERAADRQTGELLVTLDVLFVVSGNAEVVKVTVGESAISGELAMGTPVALTGLVARPWENEFNGQKRHGISFRAVAVTAQTVGAAKPVKAA